MLQNLQKIDKLGVIQNSNFNLSDLGIYLSQDSDLTKNMTVPQCLELLSCAQKYGPHVNSRFQSQFKGRTGKNISQTQIEEIYIKLRNCLLGNQPGLTFQYPQENLQNLQGEEEIMQIPRSIDILQGLNITKQEDKHEAELFFSLLQYRNPVQKYRKYPDNHAEYLFRAFSTNDIAKKLLIKKQYKSIQQINHKNMAVNFLSQCAAQKNQIQKFHQTLNKKYCEKYIQMKKVAKTQNPIQDKQAKMLENLTHPELSKLMQNQQLNEVLSSIVSLNKQRKEIMEQVKEKQKNMVNSRRKEARQNKKINNSVQIGQKRQRRQRSRDEICVREEQASD